MKKIRLTALGLVMGFVLSISAQEKAAGTTPSFKPGWFVGANGGLNLFMGEGNNFMSSSRPYVSPVKNLGYLGRLTAGYNFTPVLGLRGMLGYHLTNWGRPSEAWDGTNIFSKLGSENLTGDLMINLSNLNSGYDPNRKIDFSVFGGLGLSYLNNNTQLTPLAASLRAGVQGDYHINPSLDINLILEGNLATDNYNDVAYASIPVDIFPAFTLGFTYRLPEPGKKAPAIAPAVVEPPKVVAPVETKPAVVEPPKVVSPVETKPAVVEPPKVETKPAVVETPKVVAPVETKPVAVPTGELNEHIFYTLNQRKVVNATQEETMKQIVAYLKANPTANIIVSGFADQSTGSIDANNQISKERAVNVANKLIREYNINIKRIYVKWYGGGIQPYLKASKNRLVIVRTPKAKLTLAEPEPVKATVKPAESNPAALNTVKTTPAAPVADEGGLFLTVNFAEMHAEISEKSQEEVIMKTALYLRRHPEAKIAVSGYADKSNGSADKNNILSKERAVNVANVLIQRYSIASERIHVKWFGATRQTYTKPSMNRLVLIETISL